MAPQRGGDEIDEHDGGEATEKGERLDADDRQRKKNAGDRTQPGAGRDAENVRRHQRIAKQRLVGRAGPGERRADQDAGHDPRQPHAAKDDLARGRRPVRKPDHPAERAQHVGEGERERTNGERERQRDQKRRRQQDEDGAPHTHHRPRPPGWAPARMRSSCASVTST